MPVDYLQDTDTFGHVQPATEQHAVREHDPGVLHQSGCGCEHRHGRQHATVPGQSRRLCVGPRGLGRHRYSASEPDGQHRSAAGVQGDNRRACRRQSGRGAGQQQTAVLGLLGGLRAEGGGAATAVPPHLPRTLHQTVARTARHLSDLSTEPAERRRPQRSRSQSGIGQFVQQSGRQFRLQRDQEFVPEQSEFVVVEQQHGSLGPVRRQESPQRFLRNVIAPTTPPTLTSFPKNTHTLLRTIRLLQM